MYPRNYSTSSESRKNHYRIRNSVEWKMLRRQLIDAQNGKCPVSGRPLGRMATVHHLDMDDAHYGDFTDITKFICVSSTIHEAIHTLYKCPAGWKKALENLAILMQRMDEINGLVDGKKP